MLEKVLTWTLTVGGFGLVTWTVRYWMIKVSDKHDALEKRIQSLFELILKDYTTTKKCDEREEWIIKNEERLEEIEKWRSYLEGLTNGKTKGRIG